jgi:hypothetical protein
LDKHGTIGSAPYMSKGEIECVSQCVSERERCGLRRAGLSLRQFLDKHGAIGSAPYMSKEEQEKERVRQ